jgi:hypothetical protein
MRDRRMRILLFNLAFVAFFAGAGWVASAQVTPATAPAVTGSPAPALIETSAKAADLSMHFQHDVVFTISLGTDTPTGAKIATSLAQRLREKSRLGAGLPVKNAWIIPEGGWNLTNYLQQCAADPHTLGAFIVLPPSSAQSQLNFIVMLENTTTASFSVMIAACDHGAGRSAKLGDNTSVVWASDPATGKYERSQVEIFPLAILTSVYLAFAPQRTYQTVTTNVFPTVAPIPATGERTNVVTTNSSVLNSQSSGQVQSNVVSAFAGTAGGGLGSTIGAGGGVDLHITHAADDAIGHLLNDQLDPFCKQQYTLTADSYDPHGFCHW